MSVVAGAAALLIGVPGPFRGAPTTGPVRCHLASSPAILAPRTAKVHESPLLIVNHHHRRPTQSVVVVTNIAVDDLQQLGVAVVAHIAARSPLATAAHAPPIISHRNFQSPFPPLLLIPTSDSLTPTLSA